MTVDEKLKSAVERLTAIEKYLTERVDEDPIKYRLLILASTRCRRAREAIASHLTDAQPQGKEPWWDR